MGEIKLTPLTTPTPLNRQSPNIAHVITSAISRHTPHMVKVAVGVTSHHIAKVTTKFFLLLSVYAKIFLPTYSSDRWTDFDTQNINRRVFTQGSAFWGVRRQYFHIFTCKTPFLGTYNGKPMQNTYSHNCMIHRDTMLKFGTLLDIAQYYEHT